MAHFQQVATAGRQLCWGSGMADHGIFIILLRRGRTKGANPDGVQGLLRDGVDAHHVLGQVLRTAQSPFPHAQTPAAARLHGHPLAKSRSGRTLCF